MKIEKHLEYIISNIDITDKLSYQEKLYATKLNQLNNNYYDDNVVNRFLTTDTKEYYLNSTNRLKQAQISTKVNKLDNNSYDIDNDVDKNEVNVMYISFILFG
jgi:phosphoribosyl-AMP cyclohydrolase